MMFLSDFTLLEKVSNIIKLSIASCINLFFIAAYPSGLWRAIAFKIRYHDISMISFIYHDIMIS